SGFVRRATHGRTARTTLSLHDALPICYTQYIDEKAPLPDAEALDATIVEMVRGWAPAVESELVNAAGASRATRLALTYINAFPRSEEHTSELQSQSNLVCRLLLEKKNS